jgi:hypothetical protein
MTIDQITALTPKERNALIAQHLGISFIRYRFWYNGHDRKRPYRSHFKTREEAEENRKREIKWGCGEVEEWINETLIPNYIGSLDLMAEAEKTLTHDQCCKYHEWVDVFVAHSVEEMDGEIEYPADEFWFHAKAEQKAIAFLATITNL